VALLKEEFTSLDDDVDLDRDRVLVERCQAGDSGAFGNLYARYYERLLRFCLRRLNDRHEAEDAAQEAFARAWKALPKFAGERRFYPWLTVIAGNICTDMLRRRSRSTPTDDLELSAQQPLGSNAAETSEELILAAVDGELVNKALGRLSVRHQHVLAMREGSGWTYQQIADHEGVEIGTIETLLWRARQALKREFTVLSESKGMLGGFLVGAGALLRRGLLRVAHRGGELQQGGNAFGLRDAMAGMAFTGAAVAAALITPHALSGPSLAGASGSSTALGAAPTNLASPNGFASAFAPAGGSAAAAAAAEAAGAAGAAGTNGSPPSSSTSLGSALSAAGLSGAGGSAGANGGGLSGLTGSGGLSGGLSGALGNGTSQAVGGAVSGVAAAAGTTLGGLTQAAGGAVNGLPGTLGTVTTGLGNTVSGTGLGTVLPPLPIITPPAAPSPTTTPTTTVVGGVVNGVTNPLQTLLGGL
jgi:RNA polymerase sigma-70 factor (ECF subfamily)